jgi:hypothetical protein
LTEEAFDLYLRLLQPDGILALHISNRYLDLRPVVWKLADHFNLGAALIDAPGDGERSRRSLWVLATHNQAFLDQPAIASRTSPPPDVPATFRLWTDEYSNMFHLLNR